MPPFTEFVQFCAARPGCDKGGLYAIQPRGLRGFPIKIGYSFNLLRRLSDWEYSYPEGIDILAVARMNRPNDTHFHKRRVLQLAEALLKRELRDHIVAREEWLQPWAKAATLAAMRRLQLSLSPNLAGHFFDAAQIKAPWERHPREPARFGLSESWRRRIAANVAALAHGCSHSSLAATYCRSSCFNRASASWSTRRLWK